MTTEKLALQLRHNIRDNEALKATLIPTIAHLASQAPTGYWSTNPDLPAEWMEFNMGQWNITYHNDCLTEVRLGGVLMAQSSDNLNWAIADYVGGVCASIEIPSASWSVKGDTYLQYIACAEEGCSRHADGRSVGMFNFCKEHTPLCENCNGTGCYECDW